jgi:hypothetical protein
MTRQRQRYRQRLRHTYGRQSINRALINTLRVKVAPLVVLYIYPCRTINSIWG